jgi:uncharacterized protein
MSTYDPSGSRFNKTWDLRKILLAKDAVSRNNVVRIKTLLPTPLDIKSVVRRAPI